MLSATATPTLAADAGTLIERADALALVDQWCAEEADEDGVVPEWLMELRDTAAADLRTKAERAGLRARRMAQEADAIKAEVEVLTARLQARQRGIERLKTYLRFCLDVAGETRVETPLVTVAIQKNGGRPAIRWLLDAEAIPEAFRKPPAPPALDGTAAYEHYKAHGHLPHGFEVAGPTYSLRIR